MAPKIENVIEHLKYAKKYRDEGNAEDSMSRIRKFTDSLLVVIGKSSKYPQITKGEDREEQFEYINRLIANFVIPNEHYMLWEDLRKAGNWGSHVDNVDRPRPTIYDANKSIIRAEEALKWYRKKYNLGEDGDLNDADKKALEELLEEQSKKQEKIAETLAEEQLEREKRNRENSERERREREEIERKRQASNLGCIASIALTLLAVPVSCSIITSNMRAEQLRNVGLVTNGVIINSAGQEVTFLPANGTPTVVRGDGNASIVLTYSGAKPGKDRLVAMLVNASGGHSTPITVDNVSGTARWQISDLEQGSYGIRVGVNDTWVGVYPITVSDPDHIKHMISNAKISTDVKGYFDNITDTRTFSGPETPVGIALQFASYSPGDFVDTSLYINGYYSSKCDTFTISNVQYYCQYNSLGVGNDEFRVSINGTQVATYNFTIVEAPASSDAVSSNTEASSGSVNNAYQPLQSDATTSDRAYLGASISPISIEAARAAGYRFQGGVYVTEVVRGGPAEMAGLQIGDVIRSVNGVAINTPSDLTSLISRTTVGATLRVLVMRDNSYVFLNTTTVARPPENAPAIAR